VNWNARWNSEVLCNVLASLITKLSVCYSLCLCPVVLHTKWQDTSVSPFFCIRRRHKNELNETILKSLRERRNAAMKWRQLCFLFRGPGYVFANRIVCHVVYPFFFISTGKFWEISLKQTKTIRFQALSNSLWTP
jgi:hypothetical protein